MSDSEFDFEDNFEDKIELTYQAMRRIVEKVIEDPARPKGDIYIFIKNGNVVFFNPICKRESDCIFYTYNDDEELADIILNARKLYKSPQIITEKGELAEIDRAILILISRSEHGYVSLN